VSRPAARSSSLALGWVTAVAVAAASGLVSVLLLTVPVGGGSTVAGTAQRVVFVRAPRESVPALGDPAALRDPYPSGSEIVVWDAERPREPARLLSRGFIAAGAPRVSPDGTHVLFCGREAAGASWRIFEVPIEGGRARAVSPAEADATAAAYLPDDKIVFACDLEGGHDPRDGGPATSLFTCRRDSSDLQRITFNPASDVDPTVLADGRVLYAAWQPPGVGRERGGWGLMTVLNDGTGVASFYGSHESPEWKRRPREIGAAVFFAAAGATAQEQRLRSVAMRRPLKSLVRVGGEAGGAWRSADGWDDGRLLVSYRPPGGEDAGASFGLYLAAAGGAGEPQPLLDDPDLDELDAVAARPRAPARGHVSSVDPKADSGQLLCIDARLSDLAPAPHEGSSRAESLLVYRAAAESGSPAVGPALNVPSELLGRLPLREDGSVFFEVPADTPLRFVTIDAQERVLRDSQGWVWIRPWERRICIGCHEDRETAPPNRVPMALLDEPPAPLKLELCDEASR